MIRNEPDLTNVSQFLFNTGKQERERARSLFFFSFRRVQQSKYGGSGNSGNFDSDTRF